ncbi:MAG: PASTA domain-containing protein, partial [Alistipes sp.]
MLALSRIFLDNVPHIKAYWVMYGRQTTELALAFGADDIDGTIDDTTTIYSMAGADDKHPTMTIEDMQHIAKLKQKPFAYNLVLIVATLLALGLVSHILMQTGTRHGARRTVPDFTGVLLDDAQQIARDNDLKLCVNDSLYVSIYEGGMVLDQLPKQGVEVKPGRTVYISI